ncbi:MAG TPA: ethanolamine utilization protein EutH [Candidatus Chromulinivoraceae bacterium]|nr:ethanolamine utilization protein EutH [Candidatus Chromulinivoraceae bacterium]
MDINTIVLGILSIGIVIGGIDYCLGNKFGLGEEFENGLKTFGPLALAMLGIISLAPILSTIIRPIAVPVLRVVGADPSMAAGFLGVDMGGYPIAKSLALTPTSAAFSGLMVASMLGATLVFSIPVALNVVHKNDHSFLLKGLLAGLITIPVGAFVGGVVAGFPLKELLPNSIPLVTLSLVIALSLHFFSRHTMKAAKYLGECIVILSVIGLIIASVQLLTGKTLLSSMEPLVSGIKIVGVISIVLMGAFPLVKLLTLKAEKPLQKAGARMGINGASMAGLLTSTVNNLPMLHTFAEMDERGKVLNSAFMVSGAFLIGDHLGFVASVDPAMIGSVMLAKITAAALSIPVALLLSRSANTSISK